MATKWQLYMCKSVEDNVRTNDPYVNPTFLCENTDVNDIAKYIWKIFVKEGWTNVSKMNLKDLDITKEVKTFFEIQNVNAQVIDLARVTIKTPTSNEVGSDSSSGSSLGSSNTITYRFYIVRNNRSTTEDP